MYYSYNIIILVQRFEMSALDNTTLLGDTVDEEMMEIHELQSDERNEISATTAGGDQQSSTLPVQQSIVEVCKMALLLHAIQQRAAKENAASGSLMGPTGIREVWTIPCSQKSIPQPDRNRIVMSGSHSLRYGTTTYHYADELPSDEKCLIIFAWILAVLGTPLTLLCTLPAIYSIRRVSAMQIAKHTLV